MALHPTHAVSVCSGYGACLCNVAGKAEGIKKAIPAKSESRSIDSGKDGQKTSIHIQRGKERVKMPVTDADRRAAQAIIDEYACWFCRHCNWHKIPSNCKEIKVENTKYEVDKIAKIIAKAREDVK